MQPPVPASVHLLAGLLPPVLSPVGPQPPPWSSPVGLQLSPFPSPSWPWLGLSLLLPAFWWMPLLFGHQGVLIDSTGVGGPGRCHPSHCFRWAAISNWYLPRPQPPVPTVFGPHPPASSLRGSFSPAPSLPGLPLPHATPHGLLPPQATSPGLQVSRKHKKLQRVLLFSLYIFKWVEVCPRQCCNWASFDYNQMFILQFV